jgi:hypothetical protein
LPITLPLKIPGTPRGPLSASLTVCETIVDAFTFNPLEQGIANLRGGSFSREREGNNRARINHLEVKKEFTCDFGFLGQVKT